jgi:2,4-dienoyl-CoA reductase-like NADH-dependent reductase (Old Yellow Enzyme family)/short-subunit dehydrogenase
VTKPCPHPTDPIGSPVFAPFSLGGLTLRNRVVRSGCFEGLSQGGEVTERLIEHHRRLAAGGVAMTTLSYCSVSEDGRAFGHELWMRPEIMPGLRRFTEAVHAEGAAASIQLGHCGFFASPRVIGRRTIGASPKFCLFRLSFCREMTQGDIDEEVTHFACAATMACEAGFDAVELHAGHGYLLSQFLSPWTNRRTDRYGGSLENRLRFPVEVITAVRAAVGPDFPILVKMNSRDGWRSGLDVEDAAEVARAFEAAGASALVPSCGFTARTPLYMLRGGVPVREMVKQQEGALTKIGMTLFGRFMVQGYGYEPRFLLDEARRVRDAVSIPVAYIGGIESLEEMEGLMAEGFAFLQVGRATIRDPDFVKHLQSGALTTSDCDHCNKCVASMSRDGIRCYCESAVPGWALVTGACSGIGLALSRELARRGHPLVLVSNQEDPLRAAASSINGDFGVQTYPITLDLAAPGAASLLHSEVRRRGIEVDILVSNAGILMFGEVASIDPDRANTLLQLHVVTPSLLCTYFGSDMRARRHGHILFMSSISANRPFPGIAHYGSSKGYLRSFATSLREELRPWGVKVTCVMPGAVATNLYRHTSSPVETAKKFKVMMDPEDVARIALRAMFAGRANVVPGLASKVFNAAMRLTPRPLIRLFQDHTDFLPRPTD